MRHSGFVVSLALSACGVGGVEVDGPDETAQLGQAHAIGSVGANEALATAPSNFTYYAIRRDLRRCVWPLCGGFWVRRVNQAWTQCADGVHRQECYVAEIDHAALALSPTSLAQVEAAELSGKALERGSLRRGTSGGFTLDVFRPTEAWLQSSGATAPTGTFRRLTDLGLRCVVAPCFSTRAAALNTSTSSTVSEVSFSGAGAPAAEALEATNAMDDEGGVLAVGSLTVVPNAGPAGQGVRFSATQFYRRAN